MILREKTGVQVQTIHSFIYRFSGVEMKNISVDDAGDNDGDTRQITINFPLSSSRPDEKRLLIVDESSMIARDTLKTNTEVIFGTGNILGDILSFMSPNDKIIFVGDHCQLPPVSKATFSAALSVEYLKKLTGIQPGYFRLNHIFRQEKGNEILEIADAFRNAINAGRYARYPKIPLPKESNVHLIPDEYYLLDKYYQDFTKNGHLNSTMIAFSNWQVARINTQIRKRLFNNSRIQKNDILLVVQNNIPGDLMNGDLVQVCKVENHGKRARLNFLKIEVKLLNEDRIVNLLLIEDLLYNNLNNLSSEDNKNLLIDFDIRMRKQGIKRNSIPYQRNMRRDPYLNALRAKFGYALTCHKAQGGEWANVYLNINKSLYRLQNASLYRWYYTAVTRAKNKLYINDGWWVKGYDQRTNGIFRRSTHFLLRETRQYDGDWVKPWKGSTRAYNPVTKRHYDFKTSMFLSKKASTFSNNHWASAKEWQKIYGMVKKDQEPVLWTIKGKMEKQVAVALFNLDQVVFTNNEFGDLNKKSNDEEQKIRAIESFVMRLKINISFGGDKAYYNHINDSIKMPYQDDFRSLKDETSIEAYFSTLFHELVHWTGHTNRLNRRIANVFGDAAYRSEEIVAEIGAAYLSVWFEIDYFPKESNVAYLSMWSNKIQKGETNFLNAAKDAERAVNYLLRVSGFL